MEQYAKCEKCGQAIAEKALFCGHCGAGIRSDADKKRSRKSLIIASLALMIAGATLVYFSSLGWGIFEKDVESEQEQGNIVVDSSTATSESMSAGRPTTVRIATAATDEPITIELTVSSQVARTLTNVTVLPGDVVSVRYIDGAWRPGLEDHWIPVGLEGDGRVSNKPNFPVPNANLMSLVIGIGNEVTASVNELKSFTVPVSGELWFGPNDDVLNDNEGVIQIEIVITSSHEVAENTSTAQITDGLVIGSDINGIATPDIISADPSFPKIPITLNNASQLQLEETIGLGSFGQMALSANKQALAVVSVLGIYIYDSETLTERLFIRPGTSFSIREISLSSDGSLLATRDSNGNIKLWDLDDGSKIIDHIPPTEYGSVSHIALSPDGKTLAIARSRAGTDTGIIELIRISDEAILQSTPSNTIYKMKFSPDGALLATAHKDAIIHIWQVSDGSLLHTYTASNKMVSEIEFSPDGEKLATLSRDIQIWEIQDDGLLFTISGNYEDIAFSPNGDSLATVRSAYDEIQLWSMIDGDLTGSFRDKDVITNIGYGSENNLLFTISTAGLQMRNSNDGSVINTVAGYTGWAALSAVFPDGKKVIFAGWNGRVELWDVLEKRLIRSYVGHTSLVRGVATSPDGKLLATTGMDNKIILWNIEDGTVINIIDANIVSSDATLDIETLITVFALSSTNIAFSPDGRYLAVLIYKEVHILDISSGTSTKTFSLGEFVQAKTFEFSNDGELLAVASNGGIQILRSNDWTPVTNIVTGDTRIFDFAFSSDSSMLAILSTNYPDASVEIWSVFSNNLLISIDPRRNFQGFNSIVTFSPDDSLLATTTMGNSTTGIIVIYNVTNGDEIHTVSSAHKGPIKELDFSQDGINFFSNSIDGTFRIWGVPTTAIEDIVNVDDGTNGTPSVSGSSDGDNGNASSTNTPAGTPLSASTPSPQPYLGSEQTIILPVSADTYVTFHPSRANENYGSETTLQLGADSDENKFNILLYFDLIENIPRGATITEAHLRLSDPGPMFWGFPVEIYPIIASWDENSVTANTQPNFDNNIAMIQAYGETISLTGFPITEIVQMWVAGEIEENGILLTANVIQNIGTFQAKESVLDTHAELVIKYK